MLRNVLIVNDDGIDAIGLRILVKSMAMRGANIYVAAPGTDMSGTGKSIRLNSKIEEVSYPGAERAWIIDAPPASIVYVAVNSLLPEKPDAVISGVNHGPNLGLEDFLTSGTIGAAIEASLQGLPGVAVSHYKRGEPSEEDLHILSELALDLASFLAERNLPLIAVINYPPNPKGVMITHLAYSAYRVKVMIENGIAKPVMDEGAIYPFEADEGSDIWAFRNGLIPITLINLKKLTECGKSFVNDIVGNELRRLAEEWGRKVSSAAKRS